MEKLLKPIKLSRIKLLLWVGIMASLAFSLLNINSFLLIILFSIFLIEGRFSEKIDALKKNTLFLSFTLIFLAEAIIALKSPDLATIWKYIEKKIILILLPLILGSDVSINEKLRNKIFLLFAVSLTAASVYCVIVNIILFLQNDNVNVFFYHDLVKPIHHHAIYFSIYIVICISFLIGEKDKIVWPKDLKKLVWPWAIFLCIFLILLSSKLIISLGFLLLLIINFRQIFIKKKKKKGLITGILVLLSLIAITTVDSPLKERFDNLFKGNANVLSKEKFTPGDFFNGFQFRLLQWRFTYEILNEDKAWLTGVGGPNSQNRLRKKYTEMGMYSGDNTPGNHGYFNYNSHNQFLQSALNGGLISLAAVIFWVFCITKEAMKRNNKTLTIIIVLIISFMITESIFQRQYGLLLCTLFPLLYIQSTKTK